ncbi:glycosyltransferase [Okeania sp.]|uniref:glycosyltransferase n=1 Tax=Okeania sp. TaxID=3100323 RepID=UPI002B4B297E|nr:glycosyltransferase [Okeania sp.]MEB3342876.1 glycosyltransferase [Okeania sp.]
MKKKVCLTTLEFPPDIGGVGESVYRISRMLLELNYEVHVAVFYFPKNLKTLQRSDCKTKEKDGILIHRLKAAIRQIKSYTIMDFRSEIYFQLQQLHQHFKFDLLHSFFIKETGFLTTLLALENDLPVINSIRGSDLHKHIFDPQQHAQLCWTLEKASWLTFVSQDLCKRARMLVPNLEAKSSVFGNSIRPVDFDNFATPELVKNCRGMVVGSVGRFRNKKGLEYVLDACSQLTAENVELTLLLVGDFVTGEQEYWHTELQNSRINDRIIVTGMLSRTEAIKYLPYMDVFMIPSLNDGCPNALLEAMLASRAIVGANVDAIGEILIDGVDGLVVNPGSSEELVVALRQLQRSPQLRQDLGKSARKKVLEQLAPAVEKENWAKVYQQVLPGKIK